MSNLKAILFDFDGTLADTNQLITDSFLHVLTPLFPGKYNEENVQSFNGPPLEAVFKQLFPKDYKEKVSEYRRYNLEHHDELICLFPDVKEALTELKEAGFKLAIVSTKSNLTLNKGIKTLGLEGYFDVTVGNGDYEKFKPDPEPLFLAMSKLGVKADECMMVGDNWHDIEAGHNAGVKPIFVKWSRKEKSVIEPYKPYKMVSSMLELSQWLINYNEEECQ